MKRSKERKPIDHYLEADYPVTVYRAPEGGYVAEIEDLPGCLSEGETLEEAFESIGEARRAWIEVAYEDGLDIPLPRTERQYSGKFVVRIGRSLHRRLAEQAVREGISLNQHVESILSTSVGYERGKEESVQKSCEMLLKRMSSACERDKGESAHRLYEMLTAPLGTSHHPHHSNISAHPRWCGQPRRAGVIRQESAQQVAV